MRSVKVFPLFVSPCRPYWVSVTIVITMTANKQSQRVGPRLHSHRLFPAIRFRDP